MVSRPVVVCAQILQNLLIKYSSICLLSRYVMDLTDKKLSDGSVDKVCCCQTNNNLSDSLVDKVCHRQKNYVGWLVDKHCPSDLSSDRHWANR